MVKDIFEVSLLYTVTHAVDLGKVCIFIIITYFLSLKCIFYVFKCIHFTVVTLLLTLNNEVEIKMKIQVKALSSVNGSILE